MWFKSYKYNRREYLCIEHFEILKMLKYHRWVAKHCTDFDAAQFFYFGFTRTSLACRQFEGKNNKKKKSLHYFHSFLLKTTFSGTSFLFDPA